MPPRNAPRQSAAERVHEAAQASTAVVARSGPTIFDLVKRSESSFEKHIGNQLQAASFARAALTVLRENERLAMCVPETILGSLMFASQLGLEVGPLGHFYLVPFKKNRKNARGQWESFYVCTPIVGYKGYVQLALKSGLVKSITSKGVCEGDEFDYEEGAVPVLRHRPNVRRARNEDEAYAYWACVTLADGTFIPMVLTREEVERYRARSKASEDGPWKTDFGMMGKKTAVRRLVPFLPILEPELARASVHDEQVLRTKPGTGDFRQDDVLDVDAMDAQLPPAREHIRVTESEGGEDAGFSAAGAASTPSAPPSEPSAGPSTGQRGPDDPAGKPSSPAEPSGGGAKAETEPLAQAPPPASEQGEIEWADDDPGRPYE